MKSAQEIFLVLAPSPILYYCSKFYLSIYLSIYLYLCICVFYMYVHIYVRVNYGFALIIAKTLIDKMHHRQISNSNSLSTTSIKMVEFNLIEQLGNVKIDKDLATLQKKHENFWIQKLKTLLPPM